MPYCETVFYIIPPEQIKDVLTAFTREYFVGGRSAYHLGNDTYAIDAGENDIRAIYDQERAAIRFFCRYDKDTTFYDKKLRSFALKHRISLTSD